MSIRSDARRGQVLTASQVVALDDEDLEGWRRDLRGVLVPTAVKRAAALQRSLAWVDREWKRRRSRRKEKPCQT